MPSLNNYFFQLKWINLIDLNFLIDCLKLIIPKQNIIMNISEDELVAWIRISKNNSHLSLKSKSGNGYNEIIIEKTNEIFKNHKIKLFQNLYDWIFFV